MSVKFSDFNTFVFLLMLGFKESVNRYLGSLGELILGPFFPIAKNTFTKQLLLSSKDNLTNILQLDILDRNFFK